MWYAVVPVENMLDGYVQRTLDLLLEKNVYIVDENQVAVQFSLLANTEKIEDIRKIYVQFKTNGQCRQFLHTLHDAEIVTTNSNMESYYKIQDEPGTAAIVPHHVIQADDARMLAEDVTDAKGNHTRFIILRKGVLDVENPDLEKQLEELVSNEKGLDADADGTEKAAELTREKVRIPVYIMPATDRPGILFDILRRFYDKRINLISIMSRPTKQSMGTYNFYIEIDCLTERLEVVVETLRQIQVYNDIKILGAYKEH
ncbi:MAG: prephenate dehydratase [Coprococcus sp.]